MTQILEKPRPRRGIIFPGRTIPPEELARRKAERTKLGRRCQEIFEHIRPELIENHYNWFIAIDPDSGAYLLDPKFLGLLQKIKDRYDNKNVMLATFCLNETGVCGRI
jgi:hypothetical protein